MQFSEKFVFITGGAVRVGAALAKAFAGKGANLILHCRNSRQEAEALCKTLPNSPRHRVVTADLSLPGEAEKLFSSLGRVDVLINNASMYEAVPLAESQDLADRKHFEVNFWSPLALMKAFAAQSIPEGAVVNFVDQCIFAPSAKGGAYELSRRALAEASLELAREWGPRNLRVNCIAPGPVIPPPQFLNGGMKKTLPTLPLHRKVDLYDLCNAVLMLAGNDSMTGVILKTDCGQSL